LKSPSKSVIDLDFPALDGVHSKQSSRLTAVFYTNRKRLVLQRPVTHVQNDSWRFVPRSDFS